MKASVQEIGPWPLGVDNVHETHHVVFQGSRDTPPRLAAATNVDLDDSGWPVRRRPFVSAVARDSGEGLWQLGARTFSQADGVLYEGSTALVSGLVARLSLCEHAGLIYGSDGTTRFEIDGTTVRTWGLPVPDITATSAAGFGIAVGRYLVQATFSDARGNEGGACSPVGVVLSAAGTIAVDLSGLGDTTGATHVNIYIGEADQELPSFAAKVALAALPYTATSVKVSAGDIPVTDYQGPPPAGLAGIVSHRAYLLAWRDNVLFRSEPQEPHLFDYERNFPFPDDIRACESVEGGLWVATASGLWWMPGESPEQWIPIRKTSAAIAVGSTLIEGHKISQLQTSDRVALFCTERGLVAGLPSGGVAHLTDGRYHFDPGTRVSMAYVERGDLRQILVAVVED